MWWRRNRSMRKPWLRFVGVMRRSCWVCRAGKASVPAAIEDAGTRLALCPPYDPSKIHHRGFAQHRLGRAVACGVFAFGFGLEVRLHVSAEMARARDDAVAYADA